MKGKSEQASSLLDPSVEEKNEQPSSRREFLKLGVTSGTIAASGLLGASVSSNVAADDFSVFDADPSVNGQTRAMAVASLIQAQASKRLAETLPLPTQYDNDDESRYSNERYYASFSKTLPCNNYGEVEASSFIQLQQAMRDGQEQSFDSITLSPNADRRLANPQGAFKFEMCGLDSHATRINPSHTFRSAEIAGEMGEVYWQAITRDVPFIEYNTNNLVSDAVSDLNNFSAKPGARTATAGNLFRGETTGDLIGPYISQFLWHDFNYGPVEVQQRYTQGLANVDFMKDVTNWLAIQRGHNPSETFIADSVKRYIYNNRGLSEYVHRDVSYQAYLHAALILLSYGGAALDSGNPYKNSIVNQGGFTSLGAPFVLDMVSKAANLSLTGAWFQKWRVHRFLRPETFAGRVNFHISGERSYELHSDILNSGAVNTLLSQNGNSLLPQAYPEGSPTHPSYPAGHATIAGACVTVLKAFFDESYVIPNPVEADATGENLLNISTNLTVGNELNKLANNIAIGRDAAGVHYRQDGIQGLVAGEQQAIELLREQSLCFNEADFSGFTLTKFDGSTINISDGNVNYI